MSVLVAMLHAETGGVFAIKCGSRETQRFCDYIYDKRIAIKGFDSNEQWVCSSA
jgi:hypothetical protein